MKVKIFALAGLFLGLFTPLETIGGHRRDALSLTGFISSVFACWDKRPQFRWMQLYRYDLRHNKHQLYANRLSATFNCLRKKEKSLLKLIPFFEIRRNIDRDLWERKELGIEIGRDIFSWFYLGEGIQAVWLKEEYRQIPVGKSRDSVESETRLLLSHELLANKHISVKGYLLGEYTYDFDIGAGTRNELAIGLTAPIGKYLETGIDLRHIDRIHDYDSDTFEASVTLIF